MLNKSGIRPDLEYANTVWNSRYRKDIDIVENVLGRAPKMMLVINKLPQKDTQATIHVLQITTRWHDCDLHVSNWINIKTETDG